MAIVKMKRVRLIALARDRDELLSSLLHAGCVEVSEPSQTLAEGPDFLQRERAAVAQAKDTQEELKAAVKELNRRAPQKGGLFTPRDTMSEGALLDQAALERADALREELEVCRRSLAELRGVVACDMCGAENSAGSGRCARCGQPLRR